MFDIHARRAVIAGSGLQFNWIYANETRDVPLIPCTKKITKPQTRRNVLHNDSQAQTRTTMSCKRRTFLSDVHLLASLCVYIYMCAYYAGRVLSGRELTVDL